MSLSVSRNNAFRSFSAIILSKKSGGWQEQHDLVTMVPIGRPWLGEHPDRDFANLVVILNHEDGFSA
jgi:hypothetical protein